MKYLFASLAIAVFIFSACKEDENNIACECSATYDQYANPDTSVNEVVYIPNAFTPDYNGINDIFCVYGDGISSFHLVLKDGNTIVFQTTDQNNCWDGKVNGIVPDCKNFNYSVDITFNSGITKHFAGTVTGIDPYNACPLNFSNCKFGNQFDPVLRDWNPNVPGHEISC